MRIRTLIIALLVGGALVATACGSDDELDADPGADSLVDDGENSVPDADDGSLGDGADQAVANIGLYADSVDSPFGALSVDGARCVVAELSDDPELFAAVVAEDDFRDLSSEDQTAILVLARSCEPDRLAQELADSIQVGTGLSDDEARCLGQAAVELPEEQIEALASIAANVENPDVNAGDVLFGLLDACGLTLADLLP